MTETVTLCKVLRAEEAAELARLGSFDGSADDRRDGFVHLSTREQLPGTLEKHFAGERALWLAWCAFASDDPDLRWEASRGGALFPHLYRALITEDVVSISPAARLDQAPVG